MYRPPTAAEIEHYQTRGWLAVEDTLPLDALDELRRRVVAFTEDAAAVRANSPYGAAVTQAMLDLVWLDWQEEPWHRWTHAFAEALQGGPIDFWYDQLLLKPPRGGLPATWHQDEAFLSGAGPDLMISSWLTLQDVDPAGGCMHFEDRGHLAGVRRVLGVDGSPTEAEAAIDQSRVIAAPLRAGGMTFHSGKTPHMTLANTTDRWRNVVIQRFTLRGVPRPTGH